MRADYPTLRKEREGWGTRRWVEGKEPGALWRTGALHECRKIAADDVQDFDRDAGLLRVYGKPLANDAAWMHHVAVVPD